MPATRFEKLAEILTGYATGIKPSDVVLIEYSGTRALPLLREIYRRSLRRGAALVEYQASEPELSRDFFNLANPAQLNTFPRHRLRFLKEVTVHIGIRADENQMELAGVPRQKLMARTKLLRPLLDWRVNRTRWVVTRLPTQAMAQEAALSLEEMDDVYFGACLHDWALESAKQEPLRRMLEKASSVRIRGRDTDLVFSIAGMPALKADGHRNMPDGEVFTAPVKTSVEGHIRFNTPSYFGGTKFSGISLEFKNGKVVKAAADQGGADLDAVLATDDGAVYLGEFAFGLNPGLQRPIGNILFDEKISGSIHLALGNAYEYCGNGNRSAIHWDLVRTMSLDGEIYLDGKLVQQRGRFLPTELRRLNPPRRSPRK